MIDIEKMGVRYMEQLLIVEGDMRQLRFCLKYLFTC